MTPRRDHTPGSAYDPAARMMQAPCPPSTRRRSRSIVFTWSDKAGMTTIASGFKGPADLCAFPHDGGLMVVVPDLVKSELRLIQLGN